MNSLSRQMMQAAVLVLFLTPAHAGATACLFISCSQQMHRHFPACVAADVAPLLFCYMVETATTCQTYKHSYAEETSCGSLKGQSAFTVSRCAASQDELQEYMTVRDICYCPVRTIWWTANLSGLTVVCVCVCL